jgi:signal peptidase
MTRVTKAKKPIRKQTVLLGILALLIGLGLYQWNANTLVGNSLPMPFGFGTSVVLSGSMEPQLHVNDLTIIKASQDVDVGDIIVYQDEAELIIHRVIEVDGDTVITKGDANDISDPPISKSSIKGIMVLSVPYLGGLVRLLKSGPGFVALLLATFYVLYSSYQKDKEEQYAKQARIRREIEILRNELAKQEKKADETNS